MKESFEFGDAEKAAQQKVFFFQNSRIIVTLLKKNPLNAALEEHFGMKSF